VSSPGVGNRAQVQNAAQGTQQGSLTQTRYALEQYMPSRDKTDQYTVDHFVLAYDDFCYFIANLIEPGYG